MTTGCKIFDRKRRNTTRYGEEGYKKVNIRRIRPGVYYWGPGSGKLLAIAWGNWYNKLILRKKDGEVPLCI